MEDNAYKELIIEYIGWRALRIHSVIESEGSYARYQGALGACST